MGSRSICYDDNIAELKTLDISAIHEHQIIYDDLIQEFPLALGKAISKKNRDGLQLKFQNYVYGETEFRTAENFLGKIKAVYGRANQGSSGPLGILQGSGGLFYDLGSGTGKAVMASMILHPFSESTGIEYLEGLHAVALELRDTFSDNIVQRIGEATKCQFFHGDFLDLNIKDWTDADLVFANSTCYDDNLMKAIASIAVQMKKGSFFVTITKQLPSKDFVVLEHEMQRMSWGEATVFIMQKQTESRPRKCAENVPNEMDK